MSFLTVTSSVPFNSITPKIIDKSLEEIDPHKFEDWIKSKQRVINTKKDTLLFSYPKGFIYSNKPITYNDRLKFWNIAPSKAAAENLHSLKKTKVMTIDETNALKDHCIFIHTFPKVFDKLLGSVFSAYTKVKAFDKTEFERDHFIMLCRINRKAHEYEGSLIPETTMKGWLVYSINVKSKDCFHKCFSEKTSEYPYGNSDKNGWRNVLDGLEKKGISFPNNPPDYQHLIDTKFSDIQIFYSLTNKVLTIIDQNQTIYDITQIFN